MRQMPATLPEVMRTEAELEEVLTRPRPELVSFIRTLRSPLLVLGAGGKMGPTLAVLVQRAAEQAGHKLEVVAVSRFTDTAARRWLEERRVQTVVCNLLERKEVAELPAAQDVLYLVGLKFGTTQNPAQSWSANTIVPALVAEHYAGARLVALSTGNVYPPVPVGSGGAMETEPLTPVGEYANTAVGRERVFEYFSQRNGTRIALLRLFYAVELRYGVLRELAEKVWNRQPVELAIGYFNCIWQGDANELVVRALGLATAPAGAFNLTSPEAYRVRLVAERLAQLLDKPVQFSGTEQDTALLGNSARICAALGRPATELEPMLRWTAAWVKAGGRDLGKPTHFEGRDGRY